jgi:O-antigen ligase/tetratricopeptide (TPR) repeat protein
MENKPEYSSRINLYPVYLIGVFLIILQIINVIPPWFTPTDWGKSIIFRVILSILIFLFLFQVLFRKISISDIKEKIKSISLPFWLLVSLSGIYLLATIFSLDAHFSLWGDPRRNGGFVNFSFYIIFAILIFLTIHKKDWRKILDFAVIVGIIVSIIAIFQQFGIFSKYFIPYSVRPISTIANAILLSLYLLLLTFISLAFGIKTKSLVRKIFYFFSFLLFLSVSVFLVQTRGVFLGLIIGFLWFFFAYPKKSTKLKVYIGIVLLLVIFGAYLLKTYMDSHLYLYQKMPSLISSTLDRTLSIFEGKKVTEARFSTWIVALKALKDRPILGYGPENFMIAFDKNYDPSLPLLGPTAGNTTSYEWWDRAHNFLLDISIAAGIPALIIYLLFFAILIWQLQKVKKRKPEKAVISAGLQATFIGYLVALFFAFDSVSTYLVSFLLIGYSLHLISNNSNLQIEPESTNDKKLKFIGDKLYKYRVSIILILFVFLVFFIVNYNLKPLYFNKELNTADFYQENNMCNKSLEIVNKISPQIKSSVIIDNYLNQRLGGAIYNCFKNEQNKDENFIKEGIQILKKTITAHPFYLQNWIIIGEYTDILIEEKNKLNENIFVPTEEMVQLKNDTNYYFEKANNLSPKRQLVLRDWAKNDILTGEYEKAKEKLKECMDLNPYYSPCTWLMALTDGYSRDSEKFEYFFNLAKENGYSVNSEESLKQLINMYIRVDDYQGLAEIYPKLIQITEDKNKKAQLYASLAATYKELGQIEKARETALKILEILPEAKLSVDEFLKSLGY